MIPRCADCAFWTMNHDGELPRFTIHLLGDCCGPLPKSVTVDDAKRVKTRASTENCPVFIARVKPPRHRIRRAPKRGNGKRLLRCVARLKDLRIKRGSTQAGIARLLDVHSATVARYESGAYRPSANVQKKIWELIQRFSKEV